MGDKRLEPAPVDPLAPFPGPGGPFHPFSGLKGPAPAFCNEPRTQGAMNQALRAYLDEQANAADDEVQQALALTKGNAVEALRITLIANAFLESEVGRLTAEVKRLSVGASRGFARRKR